MRANLGTERSHHALLTTGPLASADTAVMSLASLPRISVWRDTSSGEAPAKTLIVGTSRDAALHHVADHLFTREAHWVGRLAVRIDGRTTDVFTRLDTTHFSHEDLVSGEITLVEPTGGALGL